MKKYLEVGKIINTHGFSGGLKAEPWCDSPSVLAELKTLYVLKEKAAKGNPAQVEHGDESFERLSVVKGSVNGRFAVLHIEGCGSFEEANILRERVLYAYRGDIPLPEGKHFIADLKGLPVINAESGRVYGRVINVTAVGKQDIYEIDTGGAVVLFPGVSEYVKSIDLEKGISIIPIAGFFDEV